VTIHLVGGFLGGGKTTAIAGASALLRSNGVSVGVVTNDQGRSLVDTELIRSAGIAAAEVTGGCFCCNFPQLEEMIRQLEQRAGPSVVFAEPVGSCADLVATVLKPLAASSPGTREIGRLSVFTDIRLLRQRLAGRPLPFSDDVQYIFDSQIDEAEILVLNKSDLVPRDAAREIEEKAKGRYPKKSILLQSSLKPADLRRWLDVLEAHSGASHHSIPVDYDRYAHGEMVLAWYDASLAIDLGTGSGQEIVQRLVDELRAATYGRGRPVGHLKIHVRHAGGSFKASITEDAALPTGAAAVSGNRLEIVINARAEDSAGELQYAMRAGVGRALSRAGVEWKLFNEEAFHPSRPQPFQRMP
jgi:Ni2+-binding GTPase involved in maturation of urease and hydrogenase